MATRQEFAEFFRRQGQRVISEGATLWVSAHTWVFARVPYHDRTAVPETCLEVLFRKHACLAVRFAAPVRPMTVPRGLFVFRGNGYALSDLSSKARNQTRRGLENCTVRQVRPRELGGTRYALVADTLMRQNRSNSGYSQREWQRMADAADQTPGFEAWIAEVGGRTVSLALTANVEGTYSILHQYSLSEALGLYPNNALIFEVTRAASGRIGVDAVSYGLRSLEDTVGLDRFKRHMGYAEEELTQEVVVHPLAANILAGRRARHMFDLLARRFPSSDVLRKGRAIARGFDPPPPLPPAGTGENLRLEVVSFLQVPAWDRNRLTERLIDIHLTAFADSFLTGLGRGVLRMLYRRAIAENPDLCLLLTSHDRMVGFAVGIRDPKAFYRRFLLSHLPALAGCVVFRLRGLAKASGRILRGLSYSLHQPFVHNCKLIAIGVDPGHQGLGGGARLLESFLAAVAPLGGAWLETDAADNIAAHMLYSRHGMRAHSIIPAPSGQPRALYVSWDSDADERPESAGAAAAD